MKKSQLMATTLAGIGLSAVLGIGFVSAAKPSGQTNLVDKLVGKFNLKKADVAAVFDQDKSEHQAARQANEKSRLDQLVKDGKLTADQESKISAKLTEIQTFMGTLKGKSESDRRRAIKTEMVAVKQWAIDNSIPHHLLRMGRNRHGFSGRSIGDFDDRYLADGSLATTPLD